MPASLLDPSSCENQTCLKLAPLFSMSSEIVLKSVAIFKHAIVIIVQKEYICKSSFMNSFLFFFF